MLGNEFPLREFKDDQGSASRDIFKNLKLEPELRRSGGKQDGRRFEACLFYYIPVSIYFKLKF